MSGERQKKVQVPLPLRGYIAATLVAASATALAILKDNPGAVLSVAIGFGLLAFLAEHFTVTTHSGTTYSVSFIIAIAAIVAEGPGVAAIAAVFGTMSMKDARGRPLYRHLFNAAQLLLTAAIAGQVYVWSGGPVGAADNVLPDALLPLLACTATNFLVNTSLVAGAVAMSERRRVASVWKGEYLAIGRTYVGFALLGLLLGVLYLQMGWLAMLFLLMPIFVARRALQAAIEMQSAYDDTVRSLVRAIEKKDPYTSGHAERVSKLAEMVARAYGLSEERCRAIRYAALMHDVGKLGVLNSILQKEGKLTPEEYEHMKQHPLRGVEIVGEIDLLEEAIVGVRHHHERMDGNGYPDGLAGEDIPLFARLITVADAFDSMTSTRTYRRAVDIEGAIGELHRCSGTQFDPRAIQALELALKRSDWVPAPEERDEPSAREEVDDARAASL